MASTKISGLAGFQTHPGGDRLKHGPPDDTDIFMPETCERDLLWGEIRYPEGKVM